MPWQSVLLLCAGGAA
ncbi:hypothetical protein LJC23_02815 [Desulfovibrio sp. OttesenSCG-928-I05]|nr:hypothetical protein [Desulfovibrio sp. OttesenSCG-928-I05]